ncbi:membrane fusion protein [Aquipluma nitroreducens]|uniref:Membrane fusion protein n=1 Tax=Aquipluma nitroreducens TaxID=2010828 RepID=A0A5K7SBK8_9BACT|nr:efflux RND transporter periplasmic adaptor subunit [Aquipluma nitroreducens]BBE18963.1 membrane fusion protein [Aquipluma nitroreducens]
MSNKKILLIAIPAVLLLVFYFVFRKGETDYNQVTVSVQRGTFNALIFSSGQLESEKSESINIPEKLNDRNLRIWELAITHMVEEGTVVDSGDYVATLDHKAVEEQIKLAQDDMDKMLSEYEDSKIDSNLNLSNQRDVIVNARLDLTEKKIIVDESVYESPSIRKKASMDLDKAQRKLEQEQKAYGLKKQQEVNKVERKYINYRQVSERSGELQKLFDALEITAPKAGIITYFKYPWGEIIKTGSKVGPYNSIIASIPDMTNLISRTYINEIDISKVKVGQNVKIGIDAFPDKQLTGQVTSVANIGQAMPNSDAKVFEVKIKIFGQDKDLKPAMTTSNAIDAGLFKDTLMVATDAVFENDSLKFVYLGKDNPVKQIVWLGDENENYVLVKKGLKENDVVWLSEPKDAADLKFSGVEIYAEILKDKENTKIKADKEREEMLRKKADAMSQMPGSMPPGAIVKQTK